MQTVNELLRDAAIDHQVDLAQYSNHEARRILSLLNKANTSLTAKLTDVVDRLGAESFTAQVIDAKLKSIRELLAAQYKAMGEALTADLGDVVETELWFQHSLYSSSIPAVALAAVPIVKVAPGQVRAIAFSRPFQGRLLKEWMAGLEATTASRIRDAIRMGMVEGQTTPEIIRRIMGTKAEGYANGLMEISRRDAEAVVRTAISHVNGVARDSFFAANEDILESVVWSSTLDGRTSSGCRLRDGLRYTADTHRPISHTIPWGAGPGRLHWRAVVAGTPVLTDKGAVAIDSVAPGDMVLTHEGRFKPVVAVRKKLCDSRVIRAVHTESGRVLRATDDHPVLTARSGWKFVGALEVGDELLSHPECPPEVSGISCVVGSESEYGPASRDDSNVALLRTAKLVTADINLEGDFEVWSGEIEDRAIEGVLRYPQRIKGDKSAQHHLLALGDLLSKYGRHRLSKLLLACLGELAAEHPGSGSVERSAGDVGAPDLFGYAGHMHGVIFGHALRVLGVGLGRLLGRAKRPMLVAGLALNGTGREIKQRLIGLRTDWNAVLFSEAGEASIRQPHLALNATKGFSSADVLGNDNGLVVNSFFHDRVSTLEVQEYSSTVYDLEVEEDCSYVASGVVVSNCRSSSYAITKLWSELGIEPDLGTRASLDGQVPAETTYGEWLKKQSPERQDQVLGPARGALFRSGNLDLPEFYDSKGAYLTLEQLRSKNVAAFERAGLNNPIKPPRGMPQDMIAKFLGDRQAQAELLTELFRRQGKRYTDHLQVVRQVALEEGYSSADEALAAVRWYTSGGYSKLNARTRSGIGTLQDRQFQALAASGLPGMKIIETEILRAPTKRMARADELWSRAVIGEELDVGDQFQSYSINPFVAADWADNADVLYRIERPATGAYIRPVSLIPKEDEHLIPAGLKYRVIGKSFRDIGSKRFRIIDLEIVEDE